MLATNGVLPTIGAAFLAGAGVAGMVFLLVRNVRVLWSWVVLLLPAGLLTVVTLAGTNRIDPAGHTMPTYPRLVAASVKVATGYGGGPQRASARRVASGRWSRSR